MRVLLLAAVLSTIVTLPGCRTLAPPERTAAPAGQPIRMVPGQQIVLTDGSTLRYTQVVADSRCPPRVYCIHAGDADVAFQFADAAQAPRRIVINSAPPASVQAGAWQLRLLALDFGDTPAATIQIDRAAR